MRAKMRRGEKDANIESTFSKNYRNEYFGKFYNRIRTDNQIFVERIS